MNNKDIFKVLAMIPLVIGFGIATMILSYMLVPAFIVGIVGLVTYGVYAASKEDED